MPTVAIPLKDMVVDPEKDIDLLALPESEAIALIKKSYGFLSSAVEVSIKNGIASIVFLDEDKERVDAALKSYERGLKRAGQGEYKRAIQLFTRALEVLPNHTDARRNLAMAYLESGDKGKAKDLLIQVLALDPKDAWTYVLLGNIYSKYEDKWDKAERLYNRAYELNPRDAVLLTNYGALMAERKNYEQASEFLERAIEANPAYPNAYYGMALVSVKEDKPENALAQLDNLFAKSQPGDPRSAPVFDQARKLYLEASKQVTEKSYDQLMGFVAERSKALAEQTGYAIEIVEDNSLGGIFAVTQMAWKHNRTSHLVKYRNLARAVNPHLVMHELEHIALEHEARQAGRNRSFAATPKSRERAIRSIRDDIYRLKNAGYAEDQITEVILQWVNGLCNQLFNCPLDMMIEQRIHQKYATVHLSQFASLAAAYAEDLRAFTSKDIKRVTPPRIFRASVALNCAYALFIDSLYDGKTEYARPYHTSDAFATGQKLFALWQDAEHNFTPGDEYALVDEFARLLKLQDWYEWKPDALETPLTQTDSPASSFDASPQGATDPELLKAKEPAMVMYLLSALERFEKMTDEQVRQVGFEIGTRGMEGIDYASTDRAYTLKAFPGETFSGLQMLCLMYVAFQRIDPSLNIGVDFKVAYDAAVKMFKARAN